MTVRRVSKGLPRSRAFVALRYTLIIAVAYLVLVEPEFSSPPAGLILLIVAALTSNVVMSRLPVRITDSTAFTASIIIGDTVWITATLLYSGMFGADFFYLYFFVLLFAAIGESLGLIVVGTIAVCAGYVYVLATGGETWSIWSSPSLIRIPFLFTVAVFYGYLVDRVRREQQRSRAQADMVAWLEHEVSERKQIEQGLQEAKEYAENLINSSLDMIISVDKHRNIIEFNRAAEHAFGYTKAEVLGKPLDFLYADPSESARLSSAQSRDQGFMGTVLNKRKNGEVFHSFLSASAIRDAIGTVIGSMGVSRDITERKRAEEELEATRLQLMQSAKLESVGRLAAGVAHEVKNPLAIIRQGLAYLSHAVSTTNGGTVTLVLEKMDSAITRADRVIRGLLDFSAPTAVHVTTAELNAAVEQALQLVKHELVRAHVAVLTSLASTLPPLQLDRQRIEQVLVNVFMNAIQAMPDGGTLTITTYAKPLTEFGPDVGRRKSDQFRTGEAVTVLEVEDTGAGIPDDKLDRVFDPFFTTKPIGQGSGLGLTVTRTIMELHGGTIDIRNRQEGGVRVTLTFKTEGDHGEAQETRSQAQRVLNT